ncbi:hypothetical protein [Paenibacillus physcomitrellae]|uniref:Type II secretion system protein GspF domain-containing protein n=1 Tax=Paenibacillus physcomitrellae TaxID=1619311 RepID=A0ABQ1FQ94_9BACL|nr:hypothetical protein [Paenibacillus physcomitrellae]GGA25007.1 hypothetical protein GCM10010917_07380 [Paenibacillus physcomitrellae]
MELKTLLYWVSGLSMAGFAAVIITVNILGQLMRKNNDIPLRATPAGKGKFRWKTALYLLLQRSYLLFLKIPLLRQYTLKVRSRLSIGLQQDEYRIRLRTTAMVYGLLGLISSGIIILFLMNPDPVYLMTLLITAAVMNGLLLEAYANKLQRRLLGQTDALFTAVRHAYHRSGMVDEAIREASEEAGREISAHGYRIYEALNAHEPERSLEVYYEMNPGRFLKTFAGVSYLVMEYGDKVSRGGSLFLNALSELAKEIHLDLLRLTKLDYLLKGLHVIAIAPLFFTKPIERWARGNFPLMDDFYAGKYGMLTKMVIYLVIFICYMLLQKLKSEEEYSPLKFASSWEKRLYERRVIRKLIRPFLPHPKSQSYVRNAELLRDTFSKMRVEWFYVRRLVYFAGAFVVVFSLILVLHANVRTHILNGAHSTQLLFGAPDQQERARLSAEAATDKEIMKELGMIKHPGYEKIAGSISKHTEVPLTKDQLNDSVNRIAGKLGQWKSEVLRGWEVLAALGAAVCAYYGPYWLLQFQRRIRRMEMKHEIYQFYTLIFILREMNRISVEEIMEWLNSFAVIFKTPIEKCLLHYEHGPEEAIEAMKQDVSMPEFQRLADKLVLAVSKIPVNRAFDDVDGEMGYFFEQRKLDYEKTLEMKANLGKTIGFTPMYALVFMYLVIPLIWMSFSQMTVYYEQIQKL